MRRAVGAIALLAWLAGCGVKAPPRASGTADQAPPSELFKPLPDPDEPSPADQGPSR